MSIRLKCPRCGSGECYYRVKTEDIMCKRCGKATSMKARQMILDEIEANKIALEKKRIEELKKEMERREELMKDAID